MVNEARRVLLDSILRARYLAIGQPQPKEQGSSVEQSFLELIFELQMQGMSDPQQAHQTAVRLQEENTEQLLDIFRLWEAGNGTLDRVEEHLGRWKYLHNIIERGKK